MADIFSTSKTKLDKNRRLGIFFLESDLDGQRSKHISRFTPTKPAEKAVRLNFFHLGRFFLSELFNQYRQ